MKSLSEDYSVEELQEALDDAKNYKKEQDSYIVDMLPKWMISQPPLG